MLTKLQAAKLDRRFELLDVDGTGYIGVAEYDHAAANLARAFDHPEGCAAHEKIQMAYRVLWTRLSGKNVRRLSREQFIAACSREILEPEDGYELIKRPVVQTVFELADTAGRGSLSLRDLATWFNAYGVCLDDAEKALHALDRDADGMLGNEEVHKAVQAFYCGTDPDSPANGIFGPY